MRQSWRRKGGAVENKTKVIAGTLLLAGAFAFGRWTVPTKVKIETKIVEIERKDKDLHKDRKKKTIIVKNPDGTTTTTITDDTTTDRHETDNLNKNTDTLKEITRGSQVTVSALAGVKIQGPTSIDYGLSITKPVLGPLTIGVFGLKSGTVGASVGLSF